MCVSLKSHLNSGASVSPENAVAHSAGNEGQNICGDFSETALLLRSSAPSLGWPYGQPFFLQITRMCIVHTQVLQGWRDVKLHALSSPCVLALQ